MIPTILLSFLTGTLATSGIAYWYHSNRIRVMKADVVAALQHQAEDSYRSGYIHGLVDEKVEQDKKEKAVNRIKRNLVTL
jgi:hypothetical protein